MPRPSKKKLEAALNEAGLEFNAGYEAFGKNVQAFIYPEGNTTCEDIRDIMREVGGHKPRVAYGRAVCGVSYFKAWHWDE